MKEKMKMKFEPGDLVKLEPGKTLWSHAKYDWACFTKNALFLVLAPVTTLHRVYLLTPSGLEIESYSGLFDLSHPAERNPIL